MIKHKKATVMDIFSTRYVIRYVSVFFLLFSASVQAMLQSVHGGLRCSGESSLESKISYYRDLVEALSIDKAYKDELLAEMNICILCIQGKRVVRTSLDSENFYKNLHAANVHFLALCRHYLEREGIAPRDITVECLYRYFKNIPHEYIDYLYQKIKSRSERLVGNFHSSP